MHGAGQLAGALVPRIQAVRLRQRLVIYADDAIQVRTFFVVRGDAVQVGLDQLVRGEPSRLHRAVNLRDRCFHHVERLDWSPGGLGARRQRANE